MPRDRSSALHANIGIMKSESCSNKYDRMLTASILVRVYYIVTGCIEELANAKASAVRVAGQEVNGLVHVRRGKRSGGVLFELFTGRIWINLRSFCMALTWVIVGGLVMTMCLVGYSHCTWQ